MLNCISHFLWLGRNGTHPLLPLEQQEDQTKQRVCHSHSFKKRAGVSFIEHAGVDERSEF